MYNNERSREQLVIRVLNFEGIRGNESFSLDIYRSSMR